MRCEQTLCGALPAPDNTGHIIQPAIDLNVDPLMPAVSPVNPTRVVIVDDEPALADGLAELLTLEGFSAKAVYDGAEAIALVKSFEPHCVILDIGMPGIDGAELASRLRKAHGDDIILLAMTGRDIRDPAVLSTYAMVDHYFAKPVELDALLKVLRTS